MFTPKASFASARDTKLLIGIEQADGSLTEITEITGLVGSDAVTYTSIEGYNTSMDIASNTQFIRTGQRGTTMTINVQATSVGAAKLTAFQQRQENRTIGFLGGSMSNKDLGTVTFTGGVITTWPPYAAVGEGSIGDLQFQITWTFYTSNAGQTSGIGTVQV